MSYAVIEASTHDANLVEIYQFTMGASAWYQTSSVDPITYLGQEYTPNPITRAEIALTGEINRQALDLQISSRNEIAALYIAGSPEQTVSVRILQGHRNDGEFVLIFSGRVLSCKWGKELKASLNCEPIFTAMRRGALKRNYSEKCPYVVYSASCGVGRTYVAGTITAINALSVSVDTASTITSGRLIGGTITVGTQVKTINSHSGDDLTITGPLVGVVVGDTVNLAIGCDKSLTACNTWHANLDNYGGEPYIASNNPFKGRIV
jgi:hypothetical protein